VFRETLMDALVSSVSDGVKNGRPSCRPSPLRKKRTLPKFSTITCACPESLTRTPGGEGNPLPASVAQLAPRGRLRGVWSVQHAHRPQHRGGGIPLPRSIPLIFNASFEVLFAQFIFPQLFCRTLLRSLPCRPPTLRVVSGTLRERIRRRWHRFPPNPMPNVDPF